MSETIGQPTASINDRLSVETKERLSAAGRLPAARADWYADATQRRPTVAVLIPCLNEATTIGKVVAEFRAALPNATIYVYDNNSTDRTVSIARAAGAVVRTEWRQGKGHVVRRMFADVDADVYVLVDGDDTYDARAAPVMVKLVLERRFDMVSAARDPPAPTAYRLGHKLGNAILSGMVRHVFGHGVKDMLSGYRAFNRRFVKSFPALAGGFETETEFTVHALALHMPVAEIYAPYRSRPAGSHSKLNTFADGLRILREIVTLTQHERPLSCSAVMTAILLSLAIILALPVIITFLHTGTVDRLPTAVLSASIVLLAALTLGCGLVLDAVTHGRKEMKWLSYLAIPPPPGR